MTDPCLVVIASTGRTGTTFLARTLPRLIPDAFAVHEPDVWAGFSRRSLTRIRHFGLWHMIPGRLLGRTGMRSLSTRRLAGRLSDGDLARAVRRQRLRYYRRAGRPLVIESNGQWFGVLEALPALGLPYRAVAIVRDPRTWIASAINFGHVFGPRDRVTRLGFRRMDPAMVGDVDYAEAWPRMDRFARNAWTWATTNRVLAEAADRDANILLLRFEDLFEAPDRASSLHELLAFITDFGHRRFEHEVDPTVLDHRIHSAGRASFADWRDWPPERARTLHTICGSLMERFGYGKEPDWLDLLASGAKARAGS